MNKPETVTSLDPQALLLEMKGLGLASWVLKASVAERLKEWADGVKMILQAFDAKDRAPIVEQAQAHIQANIKEEEGGEVVCAWLRFAARGLEDSQREPSGGSKPAKQRNRRTKAQIEADKAAEKSQSPAGGDKKSRLVVTEEEKEQAYSVISNGGKQEDVEKALGKKISQSTFSVWRRTANERKAKADGQPAGSGNESDQSATGNSNPEGASTPTS